MAVTNSSHDSIRDLTTLLNRQRADEATNPFIFVFPVETLMSEEEEPDWLVGRDDRGSASATPWLT